MQYCFLPSSRFCCRSRWITEYPQSWNLCSPTVLSEICWCMTFLRFWFQSRWQSLCQGLVLLNHLPSKKPPKDISDLTKSLPSLVLYCSLFVFLYKVIWLGYEDTGDKLEWIPASELTYAADLVSDFHITYPAKPSPLLLSWLCCCICPLPPHISNRDFPSLIFSIFCLFIFINPQLLYTFWGFLFKTFKLLFILILDFLTHIFKSQKINNSITEKTKPVY